MKPGYKQTDLGVLPEEWEVIELQEIADVKGGKRLPLGRSLTNEVTPHPYIRIVDVFQGGVSQEDIKYVPVDAFPFIKNYRIYAGDLFITVAGTLGLVGKIPPSLNGANLTENADRITNLKCNQDYLLAVLTSSLIQNAIEDEKTTGAQPKLALTRIQKFLIPLPPPAEQQAIAEALGAVDALLTAQRGLLAKKRDLKQATQQALLSGGTRLPGFAGEWQVKTLGELATIRKGTLITEKTRVLGDVPVIAGGQTPAYYHSKANRFGKTITISASGAYAGYVAYHNYPIFASDCSTIEESKAYDIRFIYYFLKSKQAEIYAAQTGGAQPHIHAKDIEPMQIGLPDLDEQRAIAAILSDMDVELDALAAQVAKTQALKQGMMQDLLTGAVRLAPAPSTTLTPTTTA